MGAYLAHPDTQKVCHDEGDVVKQGSYYGVAAMQGWRQSMEDSHIAYLSLQKFPELSLYGVFDGHGGSTVSLWIAQHFRETFENTLEKVKASSKEDIVSEFDCLPAHVRDVSVALRETFMELDRLMALDVHRAEMKSIFQSSYAKTAKRASTFIERVLSDPELLQRALHKVQGDSNSNEGDEKDESPVDPDDKALSEDVQDVTDVFHAPSESVVDVDAQVVSDDVKEEEADLTTDDVQDDIKESNDSEAMANAPSKNSDTTGNDAYSPEMCGATAVVTVLIKGSPSYLITANSGDSRAVINRSGVSYALSEDHKPNLEHEKARIMNAGGTIIDGRIDGNLNLSRSLGDLFYKCNASLSQSFQKITAMPDISVTRICEGDGFFILACDGIWDCWTNQQVVSFLECQLSNEVSESSCDTSISTPVKNLFDKILSTNPLYTEGIGCDNMTCLVVRISEVIQSDVAEKDKEIQFFRYHESKSGTIVPVLSSTNHCTGDELATPVV